MAMLSRGWHPPPSPMPPRMYSGEMILRLAQDRASITSSQFAPGILSQISMMKFAYAIFAEMHVLYATLVSSALSTDIMQTGVDSCFHGSTLEMNFSMIICARPSYSLIPSRMNSGYR